MNARLQVITSALTDHLRHEFGVAFFEDEELAVRRVAEAILKALDEYDLSIKQSR